MSDSQLPTRGSQRDAVIVGAGISGLTAAYELRKRGRDVLVLEATDMPGGSIRTSRVDGFLVERGPNSVRMTDELETLVIELGLTDELVAGDPKAPRFLYSGGALRPAPAGLGSFLRTPLLTAGGKLRLFAEPFVGRPGSAREQTIQEFVTRRLGRQIHDVFVSAFISGVYAGDTSKLSADAVFPKLVELEREHGGLVRGGIASLRKKRAPSAAARTTRRRPITISSFEGGLARLPEALAERLGDSVRLGAPVEQIVRRDAGLVAVAGGVEIAARELIVATPAFVAAELLRDVAPDAAAPLRAIGYAPLASVSLGYKREDVDAGHEGFGFLAPRGAGLRTLGAIFASSLFENRAPAGWVSFTCFIGGATDPGAIDLDDDALVARVAADLETAVGARGAPRPLGVIRWRNAIPQYTLGHMARIEAAERSATAAGVRLLGNYLRGVSVGECAALATKAVAEIPDS